MPSAKQVNQARGRLSRIGVIFWDVNDPAEIAERVLADYALVGKTPIDILKKRAQVRVKELDKESADEADG